MAKATKKQALGRGLSAILKTASESEINESFAVNKTAVLDTIIDVELDKIIENPFQPRTHFNEKALTELAVSIQELGVIQPITVRKIAHNKFQLVSGERRLRASKQLGLKTIPTYIRLANDQEMLAMALVENIQRKDLDPIEIALSYQRLIDEINLTQEQLSKRVGKERSTVTNYLRLLKLDPIIQTGMRDGFISMGHGRALINVEKQEDQLNIYEQIVKLKLSVRQTEDLVRKIKNGGNISALKSQQIKKSELVSQIESDFVALLGKGVCIKTNAAGKGKIEIKFSNESELNRLKKLLL
ncbi:MAG: ParB/RepB/Spo0J family partition protein [Flavobacteriaceae bacterium]|nr:ParB/RepB/Spo0J family partition protein [Flavobacteriaceae bacterium]